jgi:hypothetical protein
MFFILIILALVSGAVSIVVLWPYGVLFSIVSAPFIASFITLVGAFLIKSASFQISLLSNRTHGDVQNSPEVNLPKNLSVD